MNEAWWRRLDELDADQRRFVDLPVDGRYMLVGPPGSGKTNLLLLRAQFFAGRGERNVLFLTFTSELADFIRSGISRAGLLRGDQIQTFHSWAYRHILEFGDRGMLPTASSFEDSREQLLVSLEALSSRVPAGSLYDGVFVDEAQDFSSRELRLLSGLSARFCMCGDSNQGIYDKDGLQIAAELGLDLHVLRRQFRIGPRVGRVADKLLTATGGASLEAASNYDSHRLGDSTANMHECRDREEQFSTMIDVLRVQLDAFPSELIGVLCASKATVAELSRRFRSTDLWPLVSIHGPGLGASFGSGGPVHVITIHSAKGTEFRAVHMYGVEELRSFPLNKRRLSYTAATRAKTALNAYRTGDTNRPLDSAFALPNDFDWSDLLEGDSGD